MNDAERFLDTLRAFDGVSLKAKGKGKMLPVRSVIERFESQAKRIEELEETAEVVDAFLRAAQAAAKGESDA